MKEDREARVCKAKEVIDVIISQAKGKFVFAGMDMSLTAGTLFYAIKS